jgi:hypothetical protein
MDRDLVEEDRLSAATPVCPAAANGFVSAAIARSDQCRADDARISGVPGHWAGALLPRLVVLCELDVEPDLGGGAGRRREGGPSGERGAVGMSRHGVTGRTSVLTVASGVVAGTAHPLVDS